MFDHLDAQRPYHSRLIIRYSSRDKESFSYRQRRCTRNRRNFGLLPPVDGRRAASSPAALMSRSRSQTAWCRMILQSRFPPALRARVFSRVSASAWRRSWHCERADELYPLYACHPSRHLPPAKVRAFFDFIQESVKMKPLHSIIEARSHCQPIERLASSARQAL